MTIIENTAAYERAIERNIRNNARKTRIAKFEAECPDHEAILDFIYANTNNKFWYDVAEGVNEYGAPRPKIIEIVRERIANAGAKKAEYAERNARSKHIGTVGDKVEVEVTVTFVTSYESNFGWVDITGFITDDDCVIIHKGTAAQVETGETKTVTNYYASKEVKVKETVKKGDRIKLKATVKAHGDREGVLQTIVTRPKATKI